MTGRDDKPDKVIKPTRQPTVVLERQDYVDDRAAAEFIALLVDLLDSVGER